MIEDQIATLLLLIFLSVSCQTTKVMFSGEEATPKISYLEYTSCDSSSQKSVELYSYSQGWFKFGENDFQDVPFFDERSMYHLDETFLSYQNHSRPFVAPILNFSKPGNKMAVAFQGVYYYFLGSDQYLIEFWAQEDVDGRLEETNVEWEVLFSRKNGIERIRGNNQCWELQKVNHRILDERKRSVFLGG